MPSDTLPSASTTTSPTSACRRDLDAFPEPDEVTRAVFFGLGSDGTVGANKNSVKIVGENTPLFAQGYFVYNSKKAGSVTVSHLRFSPRPIQSSYLIQNAKLVACHQFQFLEQMDVLKIAAEGATFLLNSPYGADAVWNELPQEVQRQIIDKRLRFFVIDGYNVALRAGMRGHINTAMQTGFFALPESCLRRKLSSISKRRLARRTASAATPSSRKTSPPSIPRSPASKRLRSLPRQRAK